MRRIGFAWLTAGLMLALAVPVSAQTLRQNDSDTGWWPWAGAEWERDRDERDRDARDREIRERDDRDDREAKNGNGPPFCRNGQGHPTKGWRWCEEKGWGSNRGRAQDILGRDSRRDDRDRRDTRDDRWGEVSWEDVILRRPTSANRRLEQQTLRDILGATVLGRLSTHASRLGARGALDGRLVNLSGGSVLQLRAGGVPLAELTDSNRDGRFDLVLVAQ
jgi:hypothetical protein